jgi:SsrA-binding protein
MDKKVISTNRKAFHDYLIFDKFTAGIVLTGTEIKSVRKGMINLKDSFAKIEDGEVFLYNMHITPYEQGNRYNHKPDRIRKLLLNKQEINKMLGKIKNHGYAIIPLELSLSHDFAKIEIGLAKGKKLYDKREAIAKKTQDRDIARQIKR